MPWYAIVALVCLVIAPFDALYMHIKASRRREELRKREKKEAVPVCRASLDKLEFDGSPRLHYNIPGTNDDERGDDL